MKEKDKSEHLFIDVNEIHNTDICDDSSDYTGNKEEWSEIMRNRAEVKDELIIVPQNQRKWFEDEWETIKHFLEDDNDCLVSYNMLRNNLFGHNDRLINWQSHHEGLIDDFTTTYALSEKIYQILIDTLFCCLKDCEDLQFYELAHNMKIILDAAEKDMHLYVLKVQD